MAKNGALKGYDEANKLSQGLNPCNPIRLGLALNFSVFYYEVMNDHKKACELGEKASRRPSKKLTTSTKRPSEMPSPSSSCSRRTCPFGRRKMARTLLKTFEHILPQHFTETYEF